MGNFKNLEKQLRNNIIFEQQCNELLAQGYKEYTEIISILKANIYAFFITIPFIIVLIFVYLLRWNIHLNISPSNTLLLLLVTLFFAPIHELLHGITWYIACKNRESIHYGVYWKLLTPYCHCSQPLIFRYYFLGSLMPLFILGFGVFIIAFFSGSSFLLFLSLLNIGGAGGDILISMKLFKHKNACFLDHPSECGFVAFKKDI